MMVYVYVYEMMVYVFFYMDLELNGMDIIGFFYYF